MRHDRTCPSRSAALLCAIGAALHAAAGCDPTAFNPVPDGDPPGGQTPGGDADRGDTARLAGVWQVDGDERDLLGYFAGFKHSEGRTISTEYLVLEGDGSARILFRDVELNIVDAMETAFAPVGDGAFVLDEQGNVNANRLQLMRYELISDDELEITTVDGRKLTFVRRPDVQPDSVPTILAQAAAHAIPEREPDYSGGLANDGAMLWFTDDNDSKAYPVDPATAAVGSPITFATEWKYVQAAQGDDFWLKSRGANHHTAQRRTRADALVDDVNLNDLTGQGWYIESIAATTGSPLTWIYATGDAERTRMLFAIDTDAEPDVVVMSSAFAPYVETMVWDGRHLYVLTELVNSLIVKFDPASLKSIETFILPRDFFYWDAAAVTGDDFHVIGFDYAKDYAVLARMVPSE